MSNEEFTISRQQKLVALLESVIFLVMFFIAAWYFEFLQPGGYGWYSKTVMILLGLVGIFIHRKPRKYGLIPRDIKFSLKWSMIVFVMFLTAGLLAVLLCMLLGSPRLEYAPKLAIDFVWYLVFVGFAEEVFFRGFIQSRLNEVFTKKYKSILGVRFEWRQGTLITAIFFFGLPHLLTMVNPFTGRISVSLMGLLMGLLFAPFLGVIFGVIREKTGGIILPTVLHGMVDFVALGMAGITGMMLSNVMVGMGLFMFFGFAFERVLKNSRKDE